MRVELSLFFWKTTYFLHVYTLSASVAFSRCVFDSYTRQGDALRIGVTAVDHTSLA